MANKTEFTKALQEALAEEGGIFEDISLKDAKIVYETVLATMFNELTIPGGKVPWAGLCNLTNKEIPAKDARMGRNPATGESMEIAAKGPSVKLRMSQLKAHREAAVEAFEATQKPKRSTKRRGSSSKRTSKKTAGKAVRSSKKGGKTSRPAKRSVKRGGKRAKR